MYSVLIVDDEYDICEGIRSKLASLRIPQLGEIRACTSGEEALALCRDYRPQIVLTDIRMEGMSGIELIRELSARLYPVQFLVLSGYDSFEYVRGAFQTGAVDYLLKPPLMEDLHRIMTAAVAHLDQAGWSVSSQRGELVGVAEKVFRQLAAGEEPVGLGEHFPQGCCTGLVAFEAMQSRDAMNRRVNLLYDALGGETLCAPVSANKLALIAPSCGGTEQALRSLLMDEAFRGGQDAAASVSREGGTGEVSVLLREAEEQLCCRLRRGYGTVFVPQDRPARKNGLPAKLKHLVSQFLQNPSLAFTDGLLAALCRELTDLPLADAMCFYDYFNDLLNLGLAADGVREKARIPPFWDFGSYGELEAFLHSRLLDYANRMAARPQPTGIIDAVKRYVDENFTRNITLAELADRFFVSYSHLSKSFHKALHMSFIDYVVMLRMEYAVELLYRPELSIQEIAARVGYDNLFNFSRAFKSYYGMAPSHFRAQNTGSPRG